MLRRPLRIVAISDTHARHGDLELPAGEVLVHAGDLTVFGDVEDVQALGDWLAAQPFEHKLVIAGNHDFCFAQPEKRAAAIAALGDVIYLEDAGVELEGWHFWGSPWQPEFCNLAFNLPRGEPLAQKWAQVPDETDVLITHGPPHGILDETREGLRVGCEALRAAMPRIAPRVHIFGHIHEGAGRHEDDGVLYLNAASCNFAYEPVNPPLIADLIS